MADQPTRIYVLFFYVSFGAFSLGIAPQQILMSLLFLMGVVYALMTQSRFASAYEGLRSAALFCIIAILSAAIHQALTGFENGARIHWAIIVLWALNINVVQRINWTHLHRVMIAISIPGILFSLYQLAQPDEFAWALKVGFTMYPRSFGLVSNPITNAEGLVVIACWTLARLEFGVHKTERRLLVLHLATSMAIVLLSRVRAGLIGFAIVLCLHALLHRRHRIKALTAIAVLALGFAITIPIFGFNMASIKERINLTTHGLHLAFEHPLIGIGPENFDRFPDPNSGLAVHPHNTLIAITAETGLIGLAAFLYFMWVLGKRHLAVWASYRQTTDDLAWASQALVYVFFCFWLFGLFDYNFGDSELVMFHGYHWSLILRIPLKHEVLEARDR